MKETNSMNDPIPKCTACGSNRVVSGKLSLDAWFVFSELREDRYWTTFNNTPRFATVRDDGSASVCLDCGKVSALLTVDVKEAKRVLDKWGTDALKSRLAIGPPAP